MWLRWFFKPGLFRHYRLWLASALLLALTFGLLSLFRPLEGSLAWFTLGGYVSLGGFVGETIAGPVLWQRVIRLGALAIVAVSILSPAFAALFAIIVGRLFTFAYIGIVLAARGIGRLFHRREREPSEEQDAFGETDSAYESTLADNDSSRPEAEIDDPGDNYNRPVSRFAMAVATAPLSIESTIGESPPDGASRTANPEDAAIAELLEREETSMQANTDFDFGYSREANGAVLADAETHEYGVELEHVNGSGFDDFDSGEYQEVESVSDISQQYDQQEEEGGFSGLAVRLLGKNREQWGEAVNRDAGERAGPWRAGGPDP